MKLMSRRTWMSGIISGVVAAGLLAGASPTSAAPEKSKLLVQVYPGSMLNMPLYAGVEQGIFKKHGLEVTLQAVPSGPLAQQALVSGDLDIAYGSSDPGMAAKAKGADTQIFLGFYNANVWALVARNGVPAPSLGQGYPAVMKDFKDVRVGVTGRGAASEFIVRRMFEDAGVNADSASYIAVGGPATAYPAIIANQVDVVLAFEPVQSLMSTQGTGKILLDFRKGEGPASMQRMNGAFVTFNAARKFINGNPETIKAFQNAWIETVKWVQNPSNRAAVAKVIETNVAIGNVPNTAAVVEKLIEDNVKYYAWTVDPKGIEAYNDFLVAANLIPKAVDPADYIASVTPRP